MKTRIETIIKWFHNIKEDKMIANITGNWIRRSSPRQEAGLRIFRAEEFLYNNGYRLSQSSPVYVKSDRIILYNEILKHTDDKCIYERLEKRIKRNQGQSVAGNLHIVVYTLLNIRPVFEGLPDFDCYQPGEISVRYATENEGSFNFVELAVKTRQPFSSMRLNACDDKEQLLFNWGHTDRLVVKVRTPDNEFGKNILKVARTRSSQ